MGRDQPDDRLVVDTRAGICYAIPDGWHQYSDAESRADRALQAEPDTDVDAFPTVLVRDTPVLGADRVYADTITVVDGDVSDISARVRGSVVILLNGSEESDLDVERRAIDGHESVTVKGEGLVDIGGAVALRRWCGMTAVGAPGRIHFLLSCITAGTDDDVPEDLLAEHESIHESIRVVASDVHRAG
jgi:hypothetical protein